VLFEPPFVAILQRLAEWREAKPQHERLVAEAR
jgi:hypothetical protein